MGYAALKFIIKQLLCYTTTGSVFQIFEILFIPQALIKQDKGRTNHQSITQRLDCCNYTDESRGNCTMHRLLGQY